MYQKFIAKFNNISFTIITIISVILPFFFLPANWSGPLAVKGVILYAGVFLAFSFWLLAQFVDGSIKFPKNRALLLLGIWVVSSLVGALLSLNKNVSLWGRGFVIDSFATTLVLGLLVFLVANFARDQRRLVKLFLSTFSGLVLTLVIQMLLYLTRNVPFVAKNLSHVSSQGTLVGSWVDFAYFVTFTFLLSLLMHEVLHPKGIFRVLSLVAMALSILAIIFLNFKAVWIVTIISALVIFVYKSSVERSMSKVAQPSPSIDPSQPNNEASASDSHSHFPIMSFVALVVGLFFFLSSSSVGVLLSRYAGISFNDIRPSLSSSTHVVRATLLHDPVFGAGAGRYSDMWALYHPLEVNKTIFWNTPFDGGYSMLSSMFTTNGLLPTLVFLAVLVFALIHSFKLFNTQFPDRFSRFIAVSSLVILVTFVILFVVYSPGLVLVSLGFIYLGLLIGVSTLVGRTKLMSLEYLRDPRVSFFAILVVVVATMASFTAVFFSGNRFVSILYYNRALAATDDTKAENRLNRAIILSPNDIYWRSRASFFINKFTTLAATENADKGQLQSYFTQGEQSAKAALAYDKESTVNWLNVSQVYQLLSNDKNQDAYKGAKDAADEAQKRSPLNPVMLLNQARVSLTKADVSGAQDYISRAIELKNDYIDAYVLKGQIKASQGNSQGLVDELTAYTKVAPFDDQGYTLLGQAEINLKNYTAAVSALAQARGLNGSAVNYVNYINALIIADQKKQAIDELEAFKARFPSVTGVDERISQLKKSVTPAPLPTDTKKK